MAEYIQNGQSNYGWSLTWQAAGRYPMVADRIYNTLEEAQDYVDSLTSNACKGAVLSVIADGDNNGLYLVLSYAEAEGQKGTLKKIGSDIALSMAKVTENLPNNVKEAYQLVDDKGNAYGVQIPIYKDSSLKGVTVKEAEGKQYLSFTYITAEGGENVVDLDVSQFLVEAEFDATKGLAVNNGVVSVKLSATSSDYQGISLGFGEDGGLKIVGLKSVLEGMTTNIGQNFDLVKGVRQDLGTKDDAPLDPTVEGNENATAFARIANLYDIIKDLTGGSTSSVSSQINTAISNYDTNTVQPALEARPTTETVEGMIADAVDGLETVSGIYDADKGQLTLSGITMTDVQA